MQLRSLQRVVLFRKSIGRYRRLFSHLRDLTNHPVNGTAPDAITALDNAIVEILSSNGDARSSLSEALTIEPNLHLAQILKVFESLRYDLNADNAVRLDAIQELESLHIADMLSKRESWYSSAALAWSEGEYIRAGALLESAVMENPGDLLAIRLAQDAYMACGSSDNVLGCMIRHPTIAETPAHLNGFLRGLMIMGHVETGRVHTAEDEAERALELTRGQSCWVLHALLNCYQIQCRSSEMYAKFNEYEKKHEETGAMCHLLFNQGSAHIMRGNYSGAFKTFIQLLELAETKVDGQAKLLSPAWVNAVLLLWQLSLNTRDINVNAFDDMWKILSLNMGTPRSPMEFMCMSIVYSCAACATPTPRTTTPIHQAAANSNDTQPTRVGSDLSAEALPSANTATTAPATATATAASTSGSWWERITGTSKRKAFKKTGNPEEDAQEAQKDSLSIVSEHITENFTEKLAEHLETNVDFDLALQEHMKNMRNRQARQASARCPQLKALQPVVGIIHNSRLVLPSAGAGESAGVVSDLQFCLEQIVLPLSTAVHAFNEQEYTSATKMFLELAPLINRLGGTVAQRAVFQQMAIESSHRSGDNAMTMLLLHERSILIPGDAQCWRRLSTLYGQTGQERLAKQAHYTAWQLGIGQGGFGGPR